MTKISYTADKVFLHHWPKDTPVWPDEFKSEIDTEINKNPDKKQISIVGDLVKINDYEFSEIKKVGISIPMFQDQCTLIFEARCQDFYIHAHVTTIDDHLDVCARLSAWRKEFFPDDIR